jgi:hypothetical protein
MSATADRTWWHCYPTNDLREHLTSGENALECPCNPTFDPEYNVIYHNSFDGREEYETGQRIPH